MQTQAGIWLPAGDHITQQAKLSGLPGQKAPSVRIGGQTPPDTAHLPDKGQRRREAGANQGADRKGTGVKPGADAAVLAEIGE